MLVKFRGATVETGDNEEKEYHDRGPIYIRLEAIEVAYDHTVMTSRRRLSVMESTEEIVEKIAAAEMARAREAMDEELRRVEFAQKQAGKKPEEMELLEEMRLR